MNPASNAAVLEWPMTSSELAGLLPAADTSARNWRVLAAGREAQFDLEGAGIPLEAEASLPHPCTIMDASKTGVFPPYACVQPVRREGDR